MKIEDFGVERWMDPGYRVISIVPTYQQHTSLPRCFGADVQPLRLRESNGFLPDLDELKKLLERPTRLISLSNPNNPSGSLMSAEHLAELCRLAAAAGAYVLCDEVYRGLDQEGDGYTRSAVDLYERAISTGSMSKAYSLAGLRLGWIAGPPEVIRAVAVHRDYTTISVGMLDDYLAAVALEHRAELMTRNRGIVRRNLATLDAWLARELLLSYVRPQSGTTALLKYELPMTSRDLCVALVESAGVLLSPGSTFDMEGYVRIGYANATDVLVAWLEKLSSSLAALAAEPRGGLRGVAS
jgi:aspartate/methionine/tyrosine aminotransferase